MQRNTYFDYSPPLILPNIKGHIDYYPFGSAINTRSYSSGAYRYGFNGKEKDSESFNDAYDFGARIYDGRLGRWFRVDNKFYLFAHQSPYSYALNTPIIVVDANGEYPKPSEVLASMGFEPPPLAAGLMDGFVSGLGIFATSKIGRKFLGFE